MSVADIYQDANCNEANLTAVKSAYPRYKMPPHSTIPYAWDQPAAKEKKLVLMIQDARRVVDIMEIGALVPFKFHVGMSFPFFGAILEGFSGSESYSRRVIGCASGRSKASLAHYPLCCGAERL